MKKYAYYDTLVLPVAKVVSTDDLFTEVELEGITGAVMVIKDHIFNSEIEAVRFALKRANANVAHLAYRMEKLEGAKP